MPVIYITPSFKKNTTFLQQKYKVLLVYAALYENALYQLNIKTAIAGKVLYYSLVDLVLFFHLKVINPKALTKKMVLLDKVMLKGAHKATCFANISIKETWLG